MAMEQVNLQELQRLNDAITLTFDAIRRVAPQLQALQQLWAMPQMGIGFGYPGMQQHLGGWGINPVQQSPFHMGGSYGMQSPFQMGGFGYGVQPSPFGPTPWNMASQQPWNVQQPRPF